MKTLCLLILTACTASAFQLGDLIGNWSGRFTAREEGELAGSHRFTITGTRRADGGVTLTESSLNGGTITKFHFRKSGKFTMTSGVVSSVGKWKMDSGTLKISGKTSNPGGTESFTAELTMPRTNQFRMVEKVPHYEAISKWIANRKL